MFGQRSSFEGPFAPAKNLTPHESSGARSVICMLQQLRGIMPRKHIGRKMPPPEREQKKGSKKA